VTERHDELRTKWQRRRDMKPAIRVAITLGAFLLTSISCSSGDSDDREPTASESGDDSSTTSVAQSTTSGVSFGGATSSSDTASEEEPTSASDTDSEGTAASSDDADTEGTTCPNVADECPSECRELIGNPINVDDGCLEPDGVVIGCTGRGGPNNDFSCVTRLSDGASFMIEGRSDYYRDLWGGCSEDVVSVPLDLCSE